MAEKRNKDLKTLNTANKQCSVCRQSKQPSQYYADSISICKTCWAIKLQNNSQRRESA
jgi:hypothetical protein